MKKLFVLCSALFTAVLFASVVSAEPFNGGLTLQYATSANTIQKGSWDVRSHSRASRVNISDQYITNMSLALSVSYGLFNNLELESTTLLYQDLNTPGVNYAHGSTSNAPDGGFFRWKYGNILLTDKIVFGLQGTVRKTFGDQQNDVWLEPYYSAAFSGQLNLLFSYYQHPKSPESGFQIHYNSGYINYNDADKLSSSTDALKFFLGVVYPFSKKFTAVLESQGTYFLGYPDFADQRFSIAEYGYITPSIVWQINRSLKLAYGIDILVYEKENVASASLLPLDYPTYPDWRLTSKLAWSPGGKSYLIRLKNRKDIKDIVGEITPGGEAGVSGYYDWGGFIRDEFDSVRNNLKEIRQEQNKTETEKEKKKEKTSEK